MCEETDPKPRTILTRRSLLQKIGWAGFAALAAGCKPSGLDEQITRSAPARASSAERQASLLYLRPSEERGSATRSWLDSRFSFSFSSYRDRRFDNFRALRVLNEDWISGDRGFPMHGHRDMEIVTWVLDGELEHRDSTGGGGVIAPGEPQRMSAGTGIRHSEFNPAEAKKTHLLQIWLHPDRRGHEPGYEQTRYDSAEFQDRIVPIATPDGQGRSVTINQDATIRAGRFPKQAQRTVAVGANRFAFTHVAKGSVLINGMPLEAGDAAAWRGEGELQVETTSESEVLFFDLG